MSEDVSAFQALPGATPESSAFIDLYFDTSVRLYFTTHVNLLVNGWRVRLPYEGSIRVAVAPGAVSVVLDITLLFISKPRLNFIVQPGQVVPVFYRASHIKGDPGSLTFTKLEGRSPSESRRIRAVTIFFAVLAVSTLVPMLFVWLFIWLIYSAMS